MPPELHHDFDLIRAERHRAVSEVLRITSEHQLMDGQPELHGTLSVRELNLAHISYIQVDLGPRVRDADPDTQVDDALQRAMLLTINGVDAGMRSTGWGGPSRNQTLSAMTSWQDHLQKMPVVGQTK